MAKGKNYGPKFLGQKRIKQNIQYRCSPFPIKGGQNGLPDLVNLSFAMTQMTPMERDLLKYMGHLPEISHELPPGVDAESCHGLSVICERLDYQQISTILEIQEYIALYHDQSETLPEELNVSLRFLPMDEMEKTGKLSGCNPETLAKFVLSRLCEVFSDQVVIALTPASQQLLVALKERAAQYADYAERFLTLAEALDEETADAGSLTDPTVRRCYIDAALRRLYDS